jgi:hypothetical protein
MSVKSIFGLLTRAAIVAVISAITSQGSMAETARAVQR